MSERDMNGLGKQRGREVVVTGAGVLCHMGDDLPTLESMLREGAGTPFQPYPPAVTMNGRCQIAGIYPGELTDDDVGVSKAQGRFMGRQSRLALAAARRAMAQAGLTRRDFAVVVGSGAGDVRTHVEIQDRLAEAKNMRRILPTVVPRLMASTASANLVNVLGTTGPSFTTSAACAGGAYNLLLAAMLIEAGHCDAAVAGGCEESGSALPCRLRLDARLQLRGQRSPRACVASLCGRSRRVHLRRGCRRGGAGVARGGRGARRRRSWASCAAGACRATARATWWRRRRMARGASIEAALAHAGLSPDAIDYVNTHGTSTPAGDVSEVRAIRTVLGGRHVAYSSTKGYTGHTVSAAGAIEAIFTLAMLRGGWLAPSINAAPLDPELADYPPVLAPTARPLRHALSNSFGFGGTNVTLVLSSPAV